MDAAAQRHVERSAPDPTAARLCASDCGLRAPFAGGRRQWAETNGIFVPLDDYYEVITFR